MATKYSINYSDGKAEMSKPNSTILVYKIPYKDLVNKTVGPMIQNQFIVYILQGINNQGRDMIYVGKSKNGISNRPTGHEDKCDKWTTCYVLTQFKERTFFNDGTIQYLENCINSRINEIGTYKNTTKTTTAGTANTDDESVCDDYLEEAYLMLNLLGLDLITNSEEDLAEKDIEAGDAGGESNKLIPDGNYYFNRMVRRLGRKMTGVLKVKNGELILKAGSEVSPDMIDNRFKLIEKLRNQAKIEEGVLKEDVQVTSPSMAGAFIIGAACNGWMFWKNKNGQVINFYRKNIE